VRSPGALPAYSQAAGCALGLRLTQSPRRTASIGHPGISQIRATWRCPGSVGATAWAFRDLDLLDGRGCPTRNRYR